MALQDLDVKQRYTYNANPPGNNVGPFPIPFQYFNKEDVVIIIRRGTASTGAFQDSNISGGDQIIITGHNFASGEEVTLTSSGTLPTFNDKATPTPNVVTEPFYVENVGVNNIALHQSAADAVAGQASTRVVLTGNDGVATHTVRASSVETVLRPDDDYEFTGVDSENMHPTKLRKLPIEITLKTTPINRTLTVGEELFLVRDVASNYGEKDGDIKQDLSLSNYGEGKLIEEALDKATAIAQETNETLSRAIKRKITDSSTATLELPNPSANDYIGWDSTGEKLVNKSGTGKDGLAIHVDPINPADSQNEFNAAGAIGSVDTDDRILLEEGPTSFQKKYATIEQLMNAGIKVNNADNNPDFLANKFKDTVSISVSVDSEQLEVKIKNAISGSGNPNGAQISTFTGQIYIDTDSGNPSLNQPHNVYVATDASAPAVSNMWRLTDVATPGLDNLSDVTIASPERRQKLVYDGTQWVNEKSPFVNTNFRMQNGQWAMVTVANNNADFYDPDTPNTYSNYIKLNHVNLSTGEDSFIDRVFQLNVNEFFVTFKPNIFSNGGPIVNLIATNTFNNGVSYGAIVGASPSGCSVHTSEAGMNFALQATQTYPATITKAAGELFPISPTLVPALLRSWAMTTASVGSKAMIWYRTTSADTGGGTPNNGVAWVGISNNGGEHFHVSRQGPNTGSTTSDVLITAGHQQGLQSLLYGKNYSKWACLSYQFRYTPNYIYLIMRTGRTSDLYTENPYQIVGDDTALRENAYTQANYNMAASNDGTDDGDVLSVLWFRGTSPTAGEPRVRFRTEDIGFNGGFDPLKCYDNGNNTSLTTGVWHMAWTTQRYITAAGVATDIVSSIAADVLTLDGTHPFETGDEVQFTSTDTYPTNIAPATPYFVRDVSGTTITLHNSYAGAVANNDQVTGIGTSWTGDLTASIPAVNKHKFYGILRANNNAVTTFSQGELVAFNCYQNRKDDLSNKWETSITIWSAASQAELVATDQYGIIGVGETASKIFFTMAPRVGGKYRFIYLASLDEAEIIKDVPATSGNDHGMISPFVGSLGDHVATSGTQEIEVDAHNGVGSEVDIYGNFSNYRLLNPHRIKLLTSDVGQKTVIYSLAWHRNEALANVQGSVGILVVPDYTDVGGAGKRPWLMELKSGGSDTIAGVTENFTNSEFAFMEASNGDICPVYRTYVRDQETTTGAIFIRKLILDSTRSANNLNDDSWFDNKGTGSDLSLWTSLGPNTPAPSSVQVRGLNCCSIEFDESIEKTTGFSATAGDYVISGRYDVTDLNATPIATIWNGSSETNIPLETQTAVDNWKTFQFVYTASGSETIQLRFKNTGTAGTVHFTNVTVCEDFMKYDTNAFGSGSVDRELSENPTDRDNKIDIEAGFCGSITISQDGEHISWIQEDSLGHYRPRVNHLREVT